MLSGYWFPPHVIRFSEFASGCILSMLSKCFLYVFQFILLFPDCIVVLYEFALYLLHVYISIL